MFIFLTRVGRLFVGSAIMVAFTTFVGLNTLDTVSVASRHPASGNASCIASPATAVLDQSFTVSTTGLPTGGTVNLIITFPNGGASTSPISVSSNGAYTIKMSSAGSMFPSEQTGTYKYQFVGKMKWPAGTFNQTYATCSETVT